MLTPGRAVRILAGAIILTSGLAGCAYSPIPNILGLSVGEVRGRLEQPANGVSVVQMHAVSSRRVLRRRVPADPIVIRDGRLRQQIAVVRPNQAVHLENHDEIFHEIFSIGRENLFKARLSSGEVSQPIVLRVPGLVRAYCRLHPEESFAILVTAADHLVYLEGRSAFQIPDVSVGEYRIEATGLDGVSESKPLRVRRGQTVELTLWLEPGEDS